MSGVCPTVVNAVVLDFVDLIVSTDLALCACTRSHVGRATQWKPQASELLRSPPSAYLVYQSFLCSVYQILLSALRTRVKSK